MIGAGNLATQFAKACLRAGHDILQVFSRTAEAANVLSQQVGGAPVTDVNLLTYDADVYVLALRDSALGENPRCAMGVSSMSSSILQVPCR